MLKKELLVIVVSLLVLSGCATYHAGTVDVRSVDTYACTTSTGGLSVAADPYDTSDKAKEGFYIDVTSEGFFSCNAFIKYSVKPTAWLQQIVSLLQ